MSLSKYTTGFLINYSNNIITEYIDWSDETKNIDTELDNRRPDEATFFFGDCDGQDIFLPIEEYDSNGNLIISEVIGYDNGEAIWL